MQRQFIKKYANYLVINAPASIKSAIKHYFFPILAKRLIVIVNHAGKIYNLNAVRDHLFKTEDLVSLRKEFTSGNRMVFYVPLTIRRQYSKDIIHSGFSVFLERDEKLSRADDHFIRQGITIPEVTALKHKGVRAIVSVTERELSAFLGDAENPAHTEWERNSKNRKAALRKGR